ncbi:MAG: DHHA1 domain-containing protein [Nanoarchaeota archaeon]
MQTMDEMIEKMRSVLENSTRPLFLFDDDPDGLVSFLLLYRFAGEGKGVVLKIFPELDERLLGKVEEYGPDVVFILDKPMVSQDFLDKVHVPIYWIDHHQLQDRKKVHYFNPKLWDPIDNRPTSYWAYRIVRQDLWLGMVGMVSDWFVPEFADEFSAAYPDLLSVDVRTPDAALFTTPIGKLARIFSFNLKGTTSEVNKSVRVLTRIEDPKEILDHVTARGKFIYKKFEVLDKAYRRILASVKVTRDPIIYFEYADDSRSFTSNMSNELLFLHPKKIIIIARRKDEELRMSLRSGTVPILPVLNKALEGLEGYGGGHEMACGANVKARDREEFLSRIKAGIKTGKAGDKNG